MKKRKVEYRKGTFVDFSGRTREYIVAAVSELLPNAATVTGPGKKYDTPIQYHVTELCGDGHVDIGDQVIKRVSLGFAVCSPDDTFNEELGREIALGKALKRPAGVMYASKAGMINTDLVDALISQEMLYFENNPGAVLAGYDKAKEAYQLANHEIL